MLDEVTALCFHWTGVNGTSLVSEYASKKEHISGKIFPSTAPEVNLLTDGL